MTLDEVKAVYHKYLYLPNDTILDLIFGLIAANNMDIDSVNLYLVGPSGSGKTELIRALHGHKRVYSMGTITANTFLSAYGGRDGKGKASLLVELKESGKRIVTVKEFTSILDQRDETRREVLAQIREIADGQISRRTGNNVDIPWTGRLAFIAGVTGVIDKHYSAVQQLGERFLYYRLQTDSEVMPLYAIQNAGRMSEMREELEGVTARFLEQFDHDILPVFMPEGIERKIQLLARFVAASRSPISKDRFNQTLDYMVELEVPTRLVQQLYNISMGIAVVQGKEAVDREIYEKIITRLARDSTHSIRKSMVYTLWSKHIHGDSWANQSDICGYCVGIPRSTVRYYLNDLIALGIIEDREVNNSLYYRIKDSWVELIRDCGVYDGVGIKPKYTCEEEP